MSTPLDLRALMSALENAPDLELLQLRTAIDHLLANPKRIVAIRQRLATGQEVEFWSPADRRMHRARVVRFKPDRVLLHDAGNRLVWVEYAALVLDASHAPPAPPPRPMLGRADFALGDTVGFEGRDLLQHIGTVVRLNPKTATVSCPEGEWRVSYGLLHRVVDV